MIVCDTSPLLILAKVGRLRLLTTLYRSVEIPTAVLDEVNVRERPDAEAIRQWRHTQDVPVREPSDASLDPLSAELGDGERAALALAIERDADLVVLDDQEGRRVAKRRGLSVTGTIGILVNGVKLFSNRVPVVPNRWVYPCFADPISRSSKIECFLCDWVSILAGMCLATFRMLRFALSTRKTSNGTASFKGFLTCEAPLDSNGASKPELIGIAKQVLWQPQNGRKGLGWQKMA